MSSSRCARGGGLNFIGAAITQLTTVGLLLYMTRDLSKTDVGLFRISVALFELLMIVALVGLGQAMTRYVAVFRADRDRAAVLGAIRLGIVVTTVSSVLVGALLFLASPWLSNTLYNEPGLVTPLRFVAFAIPPGALTAVALAACSGFRTMRPNALIGLMLDPILRLVLIVGALQTRPGPGRRAVGLRRHPLHHLPARAAVALRAGSRTAGRSRAASAARSCGSPVWRGWRPSRRRASCGSTC